MSHLDKVGIAYVHGTKAKTARGTVITVGEAEGAAAIAHLARGVSILVHVLRVPEPDTSDRGPALRHLRGFPLSPIPHNWRQSQTLLNLGMSSWL